MPSPLRSGAVVPRIDVSAIRATPPAPERARPVREAIRSAMLDIGFMTITNHGVPRALIDATAQAAKRFFALPDAHKRRVAPRRWNAASPNVYRGYFPSSAAGKEGFDLGDPTLDDTALLARPYHERNVLPEELQPAWGEVTARYFDALSALSADILRAIVAAFGGLPERVDAGFARPASASTLRFNAYPENHPPACHGLDDGAPLACEAHVDSGLLTLLHQDDRGGLQVKGRDGRWHTIEPDADCFVVNSGLALERMTAGAVAATPHRVLHAPRARLSIPFFFEPVPDFLVTADSLRLPFEAPPRTQTYESYLRDALAHFAEYAREPEAL